MDEQPLFPRRRRWSSLLIAKGIIAVMPMVLLIWLLNQRFVVLSDVTVAVQPGQSNAKVAVTDAAFVATTTDPNGPWLLNHDSTSFQVKVPRRVQTLRFATELRPAKAETISWVATTADPTVPLTGLLWSQTLNQLSWPYSQSAGLTLWQRPHREKKPVRGGKMTAELVPHFSSLDGLKTERPAAGKVAAINLDPWSLSQPTPYRPTTQWRRFPVALRGPQKLYVYAANEDLSLEFIKTDLNFVSGPDRAVIKIKRADAPTDQTGQVLLERTVGDDGVTNRSGRAGPKKKITLRLPNVSAGMYVVDIQGNDDMLITDLRTTQQILAIKDRLSLADGPAFRQVTNFTGVTVLSTTSDLRLTTFHDPGKQTIQIGKKKVELTTLRHPVTVAAGPTPVQFAVSKPDIVIEGQGLFTLAPFQVPVAIATAVAPYPAPNLEPFDYVVARYQPTDRPYIAVQKTLSLDQLKINSRGVIGFSLQVPGLRRDDYTVQLQSWAVTFERGTIPWSKVWAKIWPGS